MGKNSRNKKGKAKQPLVFAKNKNQAIFAMVVFILFIGNTIYTAIKIYQDNNPIPIAANQNAPAVGTNGQPLPSEQNSQAATASDSIAVNPQNVQQDANNIYSQTVGLQKGAPAQNQQIATSGENEVDIMQKTRKNNGKMVMISVSNSGRQDPFMPPSDGLIGTYSYLTPPPETLPTNTEASKVMATTISGILYDKFSPSAIINIEGTDYLVKKGDVINKYRVLSINKTRVAVQLGKNVYQAGVGELLTQATFNEGNIPNLNKRFGGSEVSINVRRKGY
jgi:hypothetical protein